jgi:D-threonate/D-erythronate kinase
MIDLLIIADDLTGASDTAVQFSRRRVPVFVTTELTPDYLGLAREFSVVAVDTESRHLAPAEAAARVKTAVAHARRHGVGRFYKKTDSTLRGNVGAELDGLIDASGSRRLAYVPAFPRAGRTVRAGYLYVDSVLVHETAFGADPLCPVAGSFVPEVVGSQSRQRVTLVARGDYELALSAEGITVFDAVSDEDLAAIGDMLKRRQALACLAGPAGFAELLPGLLGMARVDRPRRLPVERLLVVSGSVNDVTLRQVDTAIRAGAVRLVVPVDALLGQADGAVVVNAAVGLLEANHDVIVTAAVSRDDVERCRATGALKGLDAAEVSSRVAAELGRVGGRILARVKGTGVASFGGDTSLGVVQALACRGMVPQEELAAGLVVSEAMLPSGSLTLVTKSGGFGPPDAVALVKRSLRVAAG